MIKPQRILRVLHHYPSFDRSEELRYQLGRLHWRNTGRKYSSGLFGAYDPIKELGSIHGMRRQFLSMTYKKFLKLEKGMRHG